MIKILDGKIIRDEIIKKLKQKVSVLPTTPKLAIIQVGNLPQSNKYIKNKIKFAEKIGALTELHLFDETVSENEIIALILKLNQNILVNGIILQLPLPKNLDPWEIIKHIRSDKDVDGLTDTSAHVPATARGVKNLLDYYQIPVLNRKVVIMGRSRLVGSPVKKILADMGAEVCVVHSQTKNPTTITQQADILITAIGRAKLIDAKYVKPNVIIIDIGINFAGELLVGDVDFESVKNIASAITPVPGGIGPLTVASLFENLLDACE